MDLPFQPLLEPMLAKLTDAIPAGYGWKYEPKWDGFRALVSRDGVGVWTSAPSLGQDLDADLWTRA